MKTASIFAIVVLMLLAADTARAQNSRLFDRPVSLSARRQPGPTAESASWITVPVPPPREVRVNDIISIRVDLSARTTQEGEVNRRKQSNYNALLSSWVLLEGLTQVKPAPQSDGDQQIAGSVNNQFRATGEYETSESVKFEIAANVASILPNGNLVLEAHRKVRNNEEVWLHSLTGVCHKDAVGPGNVVLSKDIASLEITKEEVGHVRDSYQRGWLQKWWDRFKAF